MAIQDSHWIKHKETVPTSPKLLQEMHVEQTISPLMIHGQKEIAKDLYKLMIKSCAKHHHMMHAPLHEAMAPKLPKMDKKCL